MGNLHITHRKIDRELLPCQDTGCDDFDRAEYNRYIVANHLFCAAYYAIENLLAHIPSGQPLPVGIPIGHLPVVGRKEIVRRSGGRDREWLGELAPIVLPLMVEEDLTDPLGEVV